MRGDTIPQEKPDFCVYFRNLKITLHLWWMYNIQLNWREFKQSEITSTNFEVPKYKENLVRAH